MVLPLGVLLASMLVAWPVRASEPAEPKAAPKTAEHASAKSADHAPAAKPTAATASTKPAADNLDQLRERLAQKLGAVKPHDAPSPNVLRVASKATAGEPAAGAHAAAPAAGPAKRAAAAPDATQLALAHRAEKSAGDGHAAHWAYRGEGGPQAWGGLKPEFSTCATGTRQSPIDIRDGIGVDLEPIQFDYRASSFRVIDNGHTVQVNIGSGNTIQAMGRRYELLQFHFHRPSEERIDGRQFDMVAHLVHKDPEGRLAVVAVLLDRGSMQPLIQTVWNNLPLEKGEELSTRAVIDLNHLLPADRRYYTYMGSLTTPPCSEGVLWMVMRQPVQMALDQIDIFARLYPMNARPIQSAAGRLIKQSN
jgi:carbonic anhydrase